MKCGSLCEHNVRQDFWFFLIEEENLCDEYSAAKSHN